MPTVKKQLWGGECWSQGYVISAVERHGSEEVSRQYVRKHGREKASTKPHSQRIQLDVF
jgi:REP element-mobilizing transposase RayT